MQNIIPWQIKPNNQTSQQECRVQKDMGCVASIFKKRPKGSQPRYRYKPVRNPYASYGTNEDKGQETTASNRVSCQACGKSFDSKHQLSDHILSAHGGNIKDEVKKQKRNDRTKREREEENRRLWNEVKSSHQGSEVSGRTDADESPRRQSRWSRVKSSASAMKAKLPTKKDVHSHLEHFVDNILADKPKKKKKKRKKRKL